jgi:hypothetical protein
MPASPSPFFELVIAAAASDPGAAEAALQSLPPELAPLCYDDPDVGPALRSPAFAAVRAKFPPPQASKSASRE